MNQIRTLEVFKHRTPYLEISRKVSILGEDSLEVKAEYKVVASRNNWYIIFEQLC